MGSIGMRSSACIYVTSPPLTKILSKHVKPYSTQSNWISGYLTCSQPRHEQMCTLNGLYNVDVNDFILSNLVDRITMYNKMMYVSPFCDLPNESSQNNGVVLVLHMLDCTSDTFSYKDSKAFNYSCRTYTI